jgi:hypothetical protein
VGFLKAHLWLGSESSIGRKTMRLWRTIVLGLGMFAIALLAVEGISADVGSSASSLVWASYDGREIDLSEGWDGAQACLVDIAGGVVECFDTRSELDSAEVGLFSSAGFNPDLSCSTPLKLFADANYKGQEEDFVDRGYWQNLSDFGFDNMTSSYKVGACSVDLADGDDGSGSWYPGDTSAGHGEPTMESGWDNRISSIYIS